MASAVFWIATRNYINEARQSAATVRRHMPDLPCVLLTPEKDDHGGFDEQYRLPKPIAGCWFLNSTRYANVALERLARYDNLLWLDTDTYLCAPLWDVFDLLKRYDIVGCHAPGRETCPTVGELPEAFPEINVGMLAFRNSRRIQVLFENWFARYEANLKTYGNNDQGPLREELWDQWQMRLCVLPPEYDFRFQFGGFARSVVKVLHGRAPNGNIEAIAETVNRSPGQFRAWGAGVLNKIK